MASIHVGRIGDGVNPQPGLKLVSCLREEEEECYEARPFGIRKI